MAKIDNGNLRMPAILHMENVETWLTGTPDEARATLVQFPGEQLRAYKVSSRVNSPKNNDENLLEAI
jgi:putative SOS response-associated peptidase YedK